jgi:hypothetical protein
MARFVFLLFVLGKIHHGHVERGNLTRVAGRKRLQPQAATVEPPSLPVITKVATLRCAVSAPPPS